MNLLSLDQDGYPSVPSVSLRTSSDHCCDSKSKIFRLVASSAIAAMYRPSGDQRGEYMPSDPATTASWWVARSRMRTLPFRWKGPAVVKTILLPSGDQFGSPCTS